MRAAGLSIEGSSVKISVFGKKGGSVKRLGDSEVTLSGSEGENTGALRDSLLKLKNELGVEALSIGIGLKHFSVNFVDLPVNSEADVARALPYELEKRLPLSPEEYVYDFITVESSKSGSKSLVLSIKRERLGWLLEALGETGLRLSGIRCSAVEAVNEVLRSAQGSAIFMYAVEKPYLVVGLRGSRPLYFRLIQEEGQLGAEVEKLRDSFGGRVYSAGAAGVDGATELDFPLSDSIALSALKKRRPLDFNFLPPELAPRKTDYYPCAIAAMSAASVAIFFLTSVLAWYKDYRALDGARARIEEIKSSASGLMEARKEVAAAGDRIRFLLEFRNDKSLAVRVLRRLSIALPEGAWLTGFSMDDKGKVEVDGYASRAASIIVPIEKSGLFKKVEFSGPIIKEEDIERFSFKMEIER